LGRRQCYGYDYDYLGIRVNFNHKPQFSLWYSATNTHIQHTVNMAYYVPCVTYLNIKLPLYKCNELKHNCKLGNTEIYGWYVQCPNSHKSKEKEAGVDLRNSVSRAHPAHQDYVLNPHLKTHIPHLLLNNHPRPQNRDYSYLLLLLQCPKFVIR
jgi:hypothetical protein